VIIEAGEVPDSAVDALTEGMLAIEDGSLDGMRRTLAAVLTAWEKRPRDLMPLVAGHDCGWQILAVQHRDAILGIRQTDVLQRCDGCGDVRTQVLTGTWTLEQLNA
jgi:hypothetical protein